MKPEKLPCFIEVSWKTCGTLSFDSFDLAERAARRQARKLGHAVGIYSAAGCLAYVVPRARRPAHTDLTPIGAPIVRARARG